MTDPNEGSPSQAAARLGISTRTVQRWIEQGRVPARRVGGRWRVAFDAFGAFEMSPTRSGAPAIAIGTLFIANRGECAVRIRRTATALGIRLVVPGEDGRPTVDLLDGAAVLAAARGGRRRRHPSGLGLPE